jgi:prevent-host-death family protein
MLVWSVKLLLDAQEVRMSTVVNIQDAKTNLSRLIMQVQNGHEVIIANRGKPVVRMTPIEVPKKRKLGLLEPKVIPDSFFEPISDVDLDSWGLS